MEIIELFILTIQLLPYTHVPYLSLPTPKMSDSACNSEFLWSTISQIIDQIFQQMVQVKPYITELYNPMQKGGWVLVVDGNNHDAVVILMHMLLESDIIIGGHYFSCITVSINFKQWDPGGCYIEKRIVSQLVLFFTGGLGAITNCFLSIVSP